MNAAKITVALIALTIVAACSRQEPPAAGPDGAELLQPFKKELQAALQAGMAQGPLEAINVCAVQAPDIAASLSIDGVRMGRTSHKLRNPGNVAPDWATDVMHSYLADASARKPVTTELGNGRIGHVEPILLQPMCITCHGEAIAPEIEELLSEAYPEDRATGFRTGDLRGIFWVEYPAGP